MKKAPKDRGLPRLGHSALQMSAWAAATRITAAGADKPAIYDINLQPDWVVGAVPSGGYVTALLTRAAQIHHAAVHNRPDQPDTIAVHVEFLRRNRVGPACIRITRLKIGRQFSILRAELLTAEGPNNQHEVSTEATITLGSLGRERHAGGPNHLTTRMNPLHLKEHMIPRESCMELVEIDDMVSFAPAFAKLRCWYPRGADGQPLLTHPILGPSVRDTWITWAPHTGARTFDVPSLSLLVDISRPMPAEYDGVTGYWYPTLQMGFEIEKDAPDGGWKWLYLRTEMTVCRNGRYGMDVTILDEGGDVVALSRHVILLVPVARNIKQKGKQDEPKL